MKAETFDAVVVGSGASGGWAAKKLTEAGLTVAVIEAGRALEPHRDFRDHTLASSLPLRGYAVSRAERTAKPVQLRSYAFSEQTSHLFVDDRDHPYSAPQDKPFTWIRSRHVGGKTLTWGRMALRFSPLDFAAPRSDGFGIEWPLSYEELAPYYDEVERFIGVSGEPANLPHLPDGQFMPAMKLSCGERLLQRSVRKKLGVPVIPGRVAVLTKDLPNRPRCHHCGPCERGCVTGSYFSSPASTLPVAAATGRLKLLTHSAVSHVTVGKDGRAQGVWCVDTRTGAHREIRGRVVVLCASTLESTRILLNSAPGGLANSSGVLGRYLMDHLTAFVGMSPIPALRGIKDSPGYVPSYLYIPRFQNLDGKRSAGFLRGYGYQGASHTTGSWGHAVAVPGIGRSLKEGILAGSPEWYLWLVAFGECLPRVENGCEIAPDTKDRWGIPTLRISMSWSDNERAMVKHMGESSREILATVGAAAMGPYVGSPGDAVHEVGTARMGKDPTTSYLNRWNQSHEINNLFVLDGAAFTSSPCQNPTLTIMALAARASDYIVAEMKRRTL